MNTPGDKLSNFLSGFKLLHYKKGETTLRAGDTPQGVFFIKKGYIKDYSISEEGEELTLIIFKPGDFFPMSWAINNTQSTHYFETMSQVELWRIPKVEFIDFIKGNPDIFFELTSHILLRLDGLLQRMEYLAFGNAHQKVASILMICAERFGLKKTNGVVIQVVLTHKEVAMLVGITRETASLELKKFERKRIIGYRGKLIYIKNVEKLQKESLLDDTPDYLE
ncbi:Crp/Fnr family transcriptional regulator [Candidatus Roizmanbacteria bacterium]|nr:Crp/Fnr family transcriptional regulator [Candidatus Roizmanbacteria bacterium]